MGKLKIAYDVINSMKEKEVISGTFKAVGLKDQVEIGHFVNGKLETSKPNYLCRSFDV